MELPGSLQTIAEIGVALAGFTGLVVALRKESGPLTGVQKFRLQVLLSMALGALFLSFLPELLLYFGVPAAGFWRISCLFLAVYSTVFLTWLAIGSHRVKAKAPEVVDWFAFARMAVGHVLVVLAQLVVVFAIFDLSGPATFLAGLVWYLIHAAQQFTRMLFIQPKTT